jgi:adenylate cyclase
MAILNDPLPCSEPCVQAVRMAVQMRTAVSDLTAKWHKRGFELGFGVGIAHGYATLGRIGPSLCVTAIGIGGLWENWKDQRS